ncbi:ABC transporter permease, partial [Pirellulaceae bacterium]|nr:ABC transporter permease [Pirellulaceae bacterium]
LRADEVQRRSPKTQGNEGAAVRNQRPTGNLNSKDKNESKQKYDSQQKYTVDKGTKHRVRKPGLDSKLLPAAINDGGVNDDKTTESSRLEGEKESSIGLDANVEEIDLVGGKKSNPILSSYASGIVVVFVLFSATGFAGTLLDENETQTLERILNGRINMTQLLAGKWIFIFAIGVLQVFCMFVWAMLYGIDFTSNFAGFFLITIGTVAASTSFAMLLATMCRTRGQLNTVSMVVILTMSAMGGSMVPRYIMSETMQQIGRFTFNAWALDGYNKVFWYGSPVAALQTEMIVLFGAAIVLFAAARWFAIRWERVA